MAIGRLGTGFGRMGAAGTASAAAAAAAAYTYRDTQITASGAGDATSFTVDIGTASADRLVVIGTGIQTNRVVASVTVNGTALARDVQNASTHAEIWSGLVTSGSGAVTVVVTWTSGNFSARGIVVWTCTGLGQNSARTTGISDSRPTSISVTNTDFLFAVMFTQNTTPVTLDNSTVAPAAAHTAASTTFSVGGADWTIAATNASFSVDQVTANSLGMAAATYR